jgi:hypothetical protein
VQDVDQDEEDRHHGCKRAAHHDDAADVSDDVGVFLGGPSRQKALGARSASLAHPDGLAGARSSELCIALLRDDPALELGGSRLFVDGKAGGRPGRRSQRGSSRG